MTKISVVIPTYNRAALLVQTVQSVLTQSRRADEIIIVDDGSTDDTAVSMVPFTSQVHYIYQKNGGLSAARNCGLKHATGDLICFLDSDDLLLPDALALLSDALQKDQEAVLAYGRAQIIDEHNAITEARWQFDDYEGDVWERLVNANFIRTAGATLIHREALLEAGGFNPCRNLDSNEDWEMWLRLAGAKPFVRVPDVVLQYRIHSSNMSSNTLRMNRTAVLMFRNLKGQRIESSSRRQKLRHAYHGYSVHTMSLTLRAIREKMRNGDYAAAAMIYTQMLRYQPDAFSHWFSAWTRSCYHLRVLPAVHKTITTATTARHSATRRSAGWKKGFRATVLAAYHRLPRPLRVGIRRALGVDSWHTPTGGTP